MGPLDGAQLAAIDVVRAATRRWADGHVQQVERLAACLYEELREYHGLGPDEELLLRSAALLHDVGYPVDPGRHHKISARMIRSQLSEPFQPEQVELIALLARYHRKGGPRLAHRRYRSLDERRRRIVTWLAGILRVADGLDRGHDSAVRFLLVSALDQRLVIEASRFPCDVAVLGECSAGTPPVGEESGNGAIWTAGSRLEVDMRGAQRKSDLLARALGLVVTIRAR